MKIGLLIYELEVKKMVSISPKKKKVYPPLRKEAFREHFWYHYIDEYLKCGKVELPNDLQTLIIAVLDRIGYECKVLDGITDETVTLLGNHERPPYYPDNEDYAKMSIQAHILLELGGSEFIAMTGCRNFVADGNTLRMNLARNISGANMLYITWVSSEVYAMRFIRFRRGSVRLDGSGRIFSSPDKVEEIESFDGVFSGTLRALFEEVTGYDTRRPEIYWLGQDGQKYRIG